MVPRGDPNTGASRYAKTVLRECCRNVSRVLRNDEFLDRRTLASPWWPVLAPLLNHKPPGSLSYRFLLGDVPQTAALNQTVEVLGKVGGVVSGALERLCH